MKAPYEPIMSAVATPARSLTVVQLIPALQSGGAERSALEVARALVTAGHQSIVISAGGRLVPQLEAEGSRHITLDIGRKSLRSLMKVGELRRVLRSFADRKGIPEPALHLYVTDPPVLLDESLPIIDALGAAQRDVSGERPPSIMRRPGADAVHLTAYGVPCVAFGPGGRMHPDARKASSMHAFGEHVLVEDCVAAAKIYLATALDLCNRKAS